jgi:hypothetical protein
MLKPSYWVAMAGMAIQDKELLQWGFHRTLPWGPARGGYFRVLESMLKDGGPWNEAPIYPIAQSDLLVMALMSRYRTLYDGQEWFARRLPGGGSVKGLMDYYLDTTYPAEKSEDGRRAWRVATVGDGSTHAGGDLFLVQPVKQPADRLLHDALAAAYAVSGDPRYAAFLAEVPGYAASLWDNRPLPAKTAWPEAPSRLWPESGFAMLRSDESPGYWLSDKALAAFQILSRGYGHDHRDKLAITLHAAGRLFYPDNDAIPYENQAIGWSGRGVAHNTLIVDEQEPADAPPTDVRHEFSPEVKFLSTSASAVFPDVDETRSLFMTSDYLLDFFRASSPFPRTYDYLLHGLGTLRPVRGPALRASDALGGRYRLLDGVEAATSGDAWSFDFDAGGAALRVTMAGEPDTLVARGAWGQELARLVVASRKRVPMDPIQTLVARRAGRRETVFVALHEPRTASGGRPGELRVLARSADALLVRVEGGEYTDLAAVAFGPQAGDREHTLAGEGASLAFRSHAYLRVSRSGAVVARGGLTGLRLASAGPLRLNGRSVESVRGADGLRFGRLPEVRAAGPAEAGETGVAISAQPDTLRVFERDKRTVSFSLRNTLASSATGEVELDAGPGLSIEPRRVPFGTLAPGETKELKLALSASAAAPGRYAVAYRAAYQVAGKAAARGAALPLSLVVGPCLSSVYRGPRPHYLVETPRYTAQLDMKQGLLRSLAAADGAELLDGQPLFTLSDGTRPLVFEGTESSFTWPREVPAGLTAGAYDRIRWTATFLADRMLLRLDRDWTQFERTFVTVPGGWAATGGAPRWRRVVAVGASGQEADAPGKGTLRARAAELELPGRAASVAFEWEPPQEVSFSGAGLSFSLGSLTGDRWVVGVCPVGGLEAWRSRGATR